ncbi:CdaR family transcriptional regulator [Pontibacillus sp. HMF3514]|uniref:PucR family transcriptional regulator n=1 Tax=Pontibacillus sp. HMF3514 TaxID=2692425 RepID=UPI0013204A35|nr:helix-turn-helix domain-containing protein [Pontibacillus sp. HMF3514]QHE51321.1 hypothetical protein GS400_04415 [Pontibacillus sp. HMF3514]
MFDQLKSLYPNIIIFESTVNVNQSQYKWFRSSNGEVFGIPFSDLEHKELQLLNTLLEPYDPKQSTLTERERIWYDWIYHHKTDNHQEKAPSQFRFVFFSLAEKGIEPNTFHEAIQGLFPHTMPILWENDHQGFIIEEQSNLYEESISYEHVIDVLMSDFYMKLYMYITPYYHALHDIPEAYKWGKQCFETKLTYFPKPVTTYQDIIPYVYIHSLDSNTKQHIVSTILGDTIHDRELLKTVRVFLECNSNATLAAKELFMHRNSLQYRVEKYIEKTNINIKQFQGALLTYLALMHVHVEEDK